LLTFEQIKELIELVARHQLSGVEVDRSGFHLKIDGFQAAAGAALPAASPGALLAAPAPLAAMAPAALGLAAGMNQALAGGAPAAPVAGAPAAGAAAAPPATPGIPGTPGATGAPGTGAAPAAPPRDAPHVLDSPIVGTFYRAASPEGPPFVEVGTRVRKGQVVCIIEAMKLMNEIESDVAGTVVEIYPQNAQAVEFGEPLFAINTAS
jgi:acetyl-CoA carboxylase biotin carboxyl carrier protein